MLELTHQKRTSISYVLVFLLPMVGMMVNFISPSLPALVKQFNVSPHLAANVVYLYTIGYALGCIVTGFLTDGLGRQKLLRLGFLIFLIVSIAPIIIPDITTLLITRFLQGLSLGAIAVLGRAILVDLWTDKERLGFVALSGTTWASGIILGPVLGGYFQDYLGWQSEFYFFTLVGIIAFLIAFVKIPETNFNRSALNIRNHLAMLLSSQLFIGLVLLMGLSYAALVIFGIMGSFLLQTNYHHSATFFSNISLIMGIVFVLSTLICHHLLKKIDPTVLMKFIVLIPLPIFLVFFILGFYFEASFSIVMLSCILLFCWAGFIYPLAMGEALSLFPAMAGTAAGITFFVVNLIVSGTSSGLIGLLGTNSNFSLMMAYLTILLVCGLIYWLLIRTKHINRRSVLN